MIKLKKYKSRYKPLYKNFVSLRKNIQNRRRLNLLKFKKKKWEKLIVFMNRLRIRRKKNYRLYDMNRYFLPKFYNSFKKKHEYTRRVKKELSLFYGYLRNKTIKKYVKSTLHQKIKFFKNYVSLNLFFIGLLEKRLDAILYRSQFVSSFRASRQLIIHGHVRVNNKIVRESSCIIQKGDLITISKKAHNLIDKNIKNSNVWPVSPKYLQINYKILQIIYLENPNFQNLSSFFPLWLDISVLLRYYR